MLDNVVSSVSRIATPRVVSQQIPRATSKELTAFGPSSTSTHLYSQEDEDLLRAPERATWHPYRRRVARIMERQSFDVVIGMVVVANVAILVAEIDNEASCLDEVSCSPLYISVFNWFFTVFYTIESSARLMVLRRSFFKNRWNVMDLGVLTAGYVELLLTAFAQELPMMQMIRLLRLGRLCRLVKLMKIFPNLHTLVTGFAGTLSAVSWGFFMIFFMLLVWGMMAVQIIHPDNKTLYPADEEDEWCAVAFTSVYNAMMYFFQTLVTGDSWGGCIIPLAREFPGHFWILSFSYITVQLGVTNLILAVIVDAAARSRDSDMEEKANENKKQQMESRNKLLKMVKSLDEDGDGTITIGEVLHNYSTNLAFQNLMTTLNIQEKDLQRVFELMDTDKSGSLGYQEFIECIVKAEQQDVRVQLMIMKLELGEMTWLLREHLGRANREKSQKSSKEVHSKPPTESVTSGSQTNLPVMTADKSIHATTSQTSLPEMSGDASIHASVSPNESQSVDRHIMPSRSPLHAPLPPVKFVDERAPHVGPEDVLEERLRQLGAVLSDRLQALAKDTADEFSALVSRTSCKPGNLAHQSASYVSPSVRPVAGSSWRQGVEDSEPLRSPLSSTANQANTCSAQYSGNKLAQKWIEQHLEHIEHL